MPFKEITSACHCAIVIPTERSDEGSLFHYNRKYFVNPHLFATEPNVGAGSVRPVWSKPFPCFAGLPLEGDLFAYKGGQWVSGRLGVRIKINNE